MATDFSAWEDEIRALAKQNRDAPCGAICFAGSSTMKLWFSLQRDFAEFPVVNCGFGGSQIFEATHFAPRILIPLAPRQIVFYSGENDLAGGKSARQIADDWNKFQSVIREALPQTHVTLFSIKPSPARWEMIGEVRAANDFLRESTPDFVDTFHPMLNSDDLPRTELWTSDGIHMARAGYKLWAEILRPHLAL